MTIYEYSIITLAVTLVMAFAGRAHGHENDSGVAGAWPRWCRTVSLAAFALLFGSASAVLWGHGWMVFDGIWSASIFALGHGNVFAMRGAQDGIGNPPSTPELIERWGGRWIYTTIFRGDIHHPIYSWWIMGLKGLLIALPIGLSAIGFMLAWPAYYWISFREVDGTSATAEWATGTFSGLTVMLLIGLKIFL